MKKYLIIGLAGFAFASCNKIKCVEPCDEEGDFRLRFENVSDRDLESLTIGDDYIGDLREGETSCYYTVDNCMVMGDSPLLTALAMDGKTELIGMNGFCATGAEPLKRGDHTVEIDLSYGCGVGLNLSIK